MRLKSTQEKLDVNLNILVFVLRDILAYWLRLAVTENVFGIWMNRLDLSFVEQLLFGFSNMVCSKSRRHVATAFITAIAAFRGFFCAQILLLF